MRRPVMCAVDASAEALQAARAAARFAERTRTSLVLVHATERDEGEDGHRHGTDVLRAVALGLAGTPYPRTMLLAGDPAKAVTETARTTDAAAIFLGARGAGRTHRFLLGSVAAELTAHPPCPVVVTADARDVVVELAGGTIVHGIGDGGASGAAVVADLARQLDCELVLVHVYGPRTVVDPYERDARARCDTAASARQALERIAAELDVPARLVVERATGTTAGVLTRVADQVGAACVSVSAPPQGPLTSALTGSAAAGLAAFGRPVLVVPSADPAAIVQVERDVVAAIRPVGGPTARAASGARRD